jgi:nucleotide sugar dehydrogenase
MKGIILAGGTAAKVIENIQRDLNIALMNELDLIFERMDIDIVDVIEAAATKWNFNVYYPGAGVGGHCLPVDPYYLVTKAEELGYHSKVITAGRAVNDYMPLHVFELLGPGADFGARSTYLLGPGRGGRYCTGAGAGYYIQCGRGE